MSQWGDWIGREERRADRVDEALFARWLATFDRSAPGGGSVPQGFHWCLCAPDAPTAQLAPDGHTSREGGADAFLPPLPNLPRRMWASSKVAFFAPLRPGMTVTRTSHVESITEKTGSSGQLVFVNVAHDTSGDGVLAVREVQSLVYRGAAEAGAAVVPPPPGPSRFDTSTWSAHRMLIPSAALLFRYSALTFNSHRIHYDAPYAHEEEGYRGLVVHGPLTATLLLDLAQRELGDNAVKTFAFRGVSPALCDEDLHLAMRASDDHYELGAFASDGRQVMSATAGV